MPYTKIVWIKLFLSLLTEDDRFLYQLNESQQLLYVKLLLLAGMTNNHIVKNPRFVCHKLNYHHEEACFVADINRIKEVFPRFKEGEFYYFENFEDIHNQVRASQRIAKRQEKDSQKAQKGLPRRRVKKESKEEDKETTYVSQVEDFFNYYITKTKKCFELTPYRRSIIISRLKEGRTLEELKMAVDNFVLDDWEKRHKFMDIIYCIGIRNKKDNLETWLNTKVKNKREFTPL